MTDPLMLIRKAVTNVREHEHPSRDDVYCLNLVGWLGERMGTVLAHHDAEVARLHEALADKAAAALRRPRVWTMPRDVWDLSDRHGVVWKWAGGPYFTSGEDQGDEMTVEELMATRWPLTEVVSTDG